LTIKQKKLLKINMFRKIEHLGIAVNNMEEALKIYEDLLGQNCYKIEVVESEFVKTAFIQVGESKIELLEATHSDSAIAKFLEKNQTGNYMRGAYGYIIKPHAAKKIVDWIAVNGFVPADNQIGDAIVDIQVVSPTVVRLHPAYFKRIGELSLTGNPDLL
jgi:GR25 family glycosyltransferase involved in LPS biosynthesis